MFSKIFKYDFKYMFGYWWVAALTATVLSVAGGFIIRGFSSESIARNLFFDILGGFGMFAVVITLILFPVCISILALVRYYKNFYSDEGYLTFTLPVKRVSLLNSKILSNFIFMAMTLLVLFFDIYLMLVIGLQHFNADLGVVLAETLQELKEIWNGYITSNLIIGFFALIFSSLMSINMAYLSITIGSIIAKKHKVLAAIGIYYAINFGLGIIIQSINLISLNAFASDQVTAQTVGGTFTGLSLTYMVVLAALAVVFYLVNLHCVQKKLNLS